jgi:hypothetical protein
MSPIPHGPSTGGRRSRPPARLIVLAALATAGVVIAAWRSAPASAPRAGTSGSAALQGERLQVAAGSGRVVRDASASGRRALELTGGDAARGRVRLAQASRLAVVVRGASCAGAPRIQVAVDGARVVSGPVGAGRRWSTLGAAATLKAGARAVAVRLLNPHRTARCRRSVRVDRLVFAAAPAASPIAAVSWSPVPGTTWQWQLSGGVDLSVDAAMYDVDLFDTSAATVADLHQRGRHVVCYLDAGTYEPGRPDAGSFPDAVLGNGVEGWPGERWLDIRRLDVLQPIIEARLDLCRSKGFDAVEPDNVDAYANSSGFPLSADDQLAFNRFIAAAAHARGLSVALKNDLDQAAALQPDFDWALDEQCYEYQECRALQPFAQAGKAVFIAEYALDPSAFCSQARAAGYSAMRKHLELDAWRQAG